MDKEELKLDLIQWLIETTDAKTLKKVQAIRNASSDLTPAQEAILDKRMEQYEKGEMKFSDWREAKARISSKLKNGL